MDAEPCSKDECYDADCHGGVVTEIEAAFVTACNEFAEIKVEIKEDISVYVGDVYSVSFKPFYALPSTDRLSLNRK